MALPLSLAAWPRRASSRWWAAGAAFLALLAVLLVRPAFGGQLALVSIALAPVCVLLVEGRAGLQRAAAAVVHSLALATFLVLRGHADEWRPAGDAFVIAADRVIGLGTLPTLALQSWWYTSGAPHWWDVLCVVVYGSHFVVLWGVAIALLVARHDTAVPYLLATALLYLAAVAVHVAWPTVPPWLAAMHGDVPMVHRLLFEVGRGLSPELYERGMQVNGNDVAAMPSLHMGGTWLVALAAARVHPWARWATLVFATLMLWSIVYGGEHWIIDAVAGALLAWACWRAALWFHTREVQP